MEFIAKLKQGITFLDHPVQDLLVLWRTHAMDMAIFLRAWFLYGCWLYFIL